MSGYESARMPCSIPLFVVVCVLFSQQCPFSSRRLPPGAEGGSTPHSAVRRQETIKAPFAPVLGKQNPDFSWTPRKESATGAQIFAE